jgi:DNA-binding transcriptional LysR family regulator
VLLGACAKRGFVPNIRFTANDQDTIVGLVAAGMGFAFLPESVDASRSGGVALRRLPWLKLTRELRAVMRSANMTAIIEEFVGCLKGVVAS